VSAVSSRGGLAVAGAFACLVGSCALVLAAPATATNPAATKPAAAAKSPSAKTGAKSDAGESMKPFDIATRARVFEEQGAYASALTELKRLHGAEGPDADLELAIALDEARTGQVDSAWTRLYSPLLEKALADSAGTLRRTEYPFQRESMWVNGTFDGWYWYIARARAELALQRRDWRELMSMASRAASARPLSGKEALLVALAAGHSGDEEYSEAAAAWSAYLEPWLPEAHYLSGIWAWRRGRRAEARERFEAAAALDSSWRDPVLALARLALPGARADSLPVRFLTGVRACAMLTSPRRPKQEEFVQFDRTPMLVFNPQVQPPDSLLAEMHLKRPTQLYLQVLVSERGEPLMAELPYVTEATVPAGIVNNVLSQIGSWRFIAARKFDKPQRSWASVEFVVKPPGSGL
jgi:hypothetical protein